MTVKELIAELMKCEPEAEVYMLMTSYSSDPYLPVDGVAESKEPDRYGYVGVKLYY